MIHCTNGSIAGILPFTTKTPRPQAIIGQFAGAGVIRSLEKTSLDFIKQVKPIQGVFDAGVVGKLFHCLQYLLLRSHGNSPISLCILALTAGES